MEGSAVDVGAVDAVGMEADWMFGVGVDSLLTAQTTPTIASTAMTIAPPRINKLTVTSFRS